MPPDIHELSNPSTPPNARPGLIAGNPASIRVTLEVGGNNETVGVQAKAELVQASSAAITATMSITQIANLPLASRSALDVLVVR